MVIVTRPKSRTASFMIVLQHFRRIPELVPVFHADIFIRTPLEFMQKSRVTQKRYYTRISGTLYILWMIFERVMEASQRWMNFSQNFVQISHSTHISILRRKAFRIN